MPPGWANCRARGLESRSPLTRRRPSPRRRAARIPEVLIDVNVGLPRCGCSPGDAGRLADVARRSGLEVRGVMGYEGHIVGLEDRSRRLTMLEPSMAMLVDAASEVGGEMISAGGQGRSTSIPGPPRSKPAHTRSMDTAYAKLDLPFVQALSVLSTVISVSKDWAVADCGLKALGMDHGNPSRRGCGRVVLLGRARRLCAGDSTEGGRPDSRAPRPRRSHGGIPPAPLRRRRRRGAGPVGDQPPGLVGQNSKTSRPRTPPASSNRWASGACFEGSVPATRRVRSPPSARCRSASSLSCSVA